ncbi:unnamed protein product [Pedinophyceae sp. YPF-701]|nr:unnamed protein product [Pedinophyceae sp. YPF-701]
MGAPAAAPAPSAQEPSPGVRPVKHVVFDFDGLVLDTEGLIMGVAKEVCEGHGRPLRRSVSSKALGMRPVEAWQTVADSLGIEATGEQLFTESEALLKNKWHEARMMPGAERLLQHLSRHNVPLGLATSSLSTTFVNKIAGRDHLLDLFDAKVFGDEVDKGKPHPDIFLECARRLGADPAECLVIEDSPNGLEAARAAGMRSIAVPSLTDRDQYPAADLAAPAGCCEVLPSLLDMRPEVYGLPRFTDQVCGCVPLDHPWRIKGPVVRGFGRGSKLLGIPTANLCPESLENQLAEAVSGIYIGFCSLGDRPEVYEFAMSVGWNPVFKNKQRTAEPWILHEFAEDFYGEELRLVTVAYIRPECDFPGLDALKERIHEDGRIARAALAQPPLAALREDPFLRPASP